MSKKGNFNINNSEKTILKSPFNILKSPFKSISISTEENKDFLESGLEDYIERLENVENNTEVLKSANDKIIKDFYVKYNKIKIENQKIQNNIKQIKKDKISLVSLVGAFVTIFTFISVEIQILRYVTDFTRIAGITVIMLGGTLLCIIFVQIIMDGMLRDFSDEVMNKRNNNIMVKLFLLMFFSAGLVIAGLWTTSCGDRKNSSVIENNEVILEMQQKIEELENDEGINVFNNRSINGTCESYQDK